MHLTLENHCAERVTHFCSQHLRLKESRNRLRYCPTMKIQETMIRPTMTLIKTVRNGKNKSSNLRYRMLVKTNSRRTNLNSPDQHRPRRAISINTSICLPSRTKTTKPRIILADFPSKVRLPLFIGLVWLTIFAFFVAVLLSIFSYLDDISLWNASEVCRRWRKILEAHTPQTMWQKYLKERWPLYDSLVQKPNWFHVRYHSGVFACIVEI